MLHRRRPAAALRRLVEGALAFTLGLALTGVAFAQNITPEVTFLHRNATGDVVARTDASGAVVWRADVLPFSRLILDPANVETPARYLGQNREQEIGPEGGLYRLGARMYAPFNGSFISPDPLSLAQIDLADPQRFNQYSYGLNNPYRYTDSSGLIAETAWDVVSVGMGIAAIAMWNDQTSTLDKIMDVGGLGYDGLAAAVPFLPAGVGAVLKARRAAKALAVTADVASTTTKAAKARKGAKVAKAAAATKGSGKVTKDVIKRGKPGRDGGASEHIIEKMDGKTISKTHRVTKDGKVVHQHQDHIGKHGGERRFPDEWTGTDTINAPEHLPKVGYGKSFPSIPQPVSSP